jgi:L-asparaginase II
MKPALLIETYRSELVEKQHFGFILAIDREENVVFRAGDDYNRNFWLRSAAKPLQASLIIDSGAFEKFDFSLQELAVCSASHTGTDLHTNTVKGLLNKLGLEEKHLKCGVHEPLDKKAKCSAVEFSQLHNNCSGKHAGMLAVCKANNWDINNYLDFEHPYQQRLTTRISELCNFDQSKISVGRDGCEAPVHSLPHIKMGTGFLNLFLDSKYEKIKQAFQKYPFFIGGNERLDSEIIRATSGKLISKVAAEGLCITVNLEQKQALIVKILDADMKARAIAVSETLHRLNWISKEEYINLCQISLFNKEITTHTNKHAGNIKFYDDRY